MSMAGPDTDMTCKYPTRLTKEAGAAGYTSLRSAKGTDVGNSGVLQKALTEETWLQMMSLSEYGSYRAFWTLNCLSFPS